MGNENLQATIPVDYRLVLFSVVVVLAVINGGKGLPHTKAAWTQESGRLTVMANTSFWGKVAQRTSATTNIESAVTIWDVQGLISVNYGLGKHFRP